MKLWRTLEDEENPDPVRDIHINNPDCWLRPCFQPGMMHSAGSMFDQYVKYLARTQRHKLQADTKGLDALRALKEYLSKP